MRATERDRRIRQAVELMEQFAGRTGLSSKLPTQRYLWTDAFAVCNFLGLSRATGERRFEQLAMQLIDQVHHALGRHRADDSRSGWLSRLGEPEGAAHPTLGGLRIGKALPERQAEEPFDEQLEWERDGQYFHYLTRWMHALDQLSRATARPQFNLWARELAQVAWAAFSHPAAMGPSQKLAWKMSIDLSRPLVSSSGQHDALDGFITCAQLKTTARQLPAGSGPALSEELAGLATLASGTDWVTFDPLGIGGLLFDAGRVAQLSGGGVLSNGRLLRALLAAAIEGLARWGVEPFRGPASTRLAFRELGLSIGLHALPTIRQHVESDPGQFSHPAGLRAGLEAIGRYIPVGAAIETFWLDPRQREAPTWLEHRDLNEVMLATSLLPEGLVVLPQLQPGAPAARL